MVVDTGKATDTKDSVAVEEVATVREDVVVTRVASKTLVTVLISRRFIGISEVPIGILFRDTVEHMLAVNAAVKRLVVDAEMTVHLWDVAVEEDDIYQKLKLIGQTSSVEDVVAKDVEKKMVLALGEEHIDS